MLAKTKTEDARRLQEYLNRCNRKKHLGQLVRAGGVDRKFLSCELAIPYLDLVYGTHLKPIIQRFNQNLRAKGYFSSKWDLLAEKIRKFLTVKLAVNLLPVVWFRSKPIVSRKVLAKRFGFSPELCTIRDDLRAVLDEFNSKIDPKLYPQPSKYNKYASALEKAAFSNPPVHRGRLDKTALAAKIGINPVHLDRTPSLAKIVNEAETQLEKTLHQPVTVLNPDGSVAIKGELDPHVVEHRRRYGFREFVAGFGLKFTLQAALAFARSVATLSNASGQKLYCSLVDFFRWAVTQKTKFCQEAKSGSITEESLEDAAYAWRGYIISEKNRRKDTTHAGEIKALNGILSKLAEQQLLPQITPLITIRRHRRKTRPRPSFVELPVGMHMHEFLAKNNVSSADKKVFVSALKKARAHTPGLPEDDAKAIQIVNLRILLEMRSAAERELLYYRSEFEKGSALKALSDLSGAELESIILKMRADNMHPQNIMEHLLPLNPPEQGLGRLLCFLSHRFGAVIPRWKKFDCLGHFYADCYRRFDGIGRNTIEGYLTARIEAIAAAVTICLIDTGFNVSTGRRLPIDCLSESQVPGHKKISGFKDRSNGRPVRADLPVGSTDQKVSAVQAIEWIIEMTMPLRQSAKANASRALFLYRGNNDRVEAISEFRYTREFKRLLKRQKISPEKKYVPAMIRSSVLLDSLLRNDGALTEAQLIANHANSDETDGYTNKYPARMLRENLIRRFQSELQAVISIDVTNVAHKLGIKPFEFHRCFDEAVKNRLGVLCNSKTIPNQLNSGEGRDQSQILVPCTPENIASLIQWHEELELARPEWERQNPIRWKTQWLPWLVLTQVVLDRISRGPLVRVLQEARSIVEHNRAKGIRGPKPW